MSNMSRKRTTRYTAFHYKGHCVKVNQIILGGEITVIMSILVIFIYILNQL